jgi:uncharacterized membrane protein
MMLEEPTKSLIVGCVFVLLSFASMLLISARTSSLPGLVLLALGFACCACTVWILVRLHRQVRTLEGVRHGQAAQLHD